MNRTFNSLVAATSLAVGLLGSAANVEAHDRDRIRINPGRVEIDIGGRDGVRIGIGNRLPEYAPLPQPAVFCHIELSDPFRRYGQWYQREIVVCPEVQQQPVIILPPRGHPGRRW